MSTPLRVGEWRIPDTGFRLHDELPGRAVPAARVRAPLPPHDPAGDGERRQAVRDVCRLPGDRVREKIADVFTKLCSFKTPSGSSLSIHFLLFPLQNFNATRMKMIKQSHVSGFLITERCWRFVIYSILMTGDPWWTQSEERGSAFSAAGSRTDTTLPRWNICRTIVSRETS